MMTCFEMVMMVTKVLHPKFCARLHLAAREASEAK
jgi:hypothetical protein